MIYKWDKDKEHWETKVILKPCKGYSSYDGIPEPKFKPGDFVRILEKGECGIDKYMVLKVSAEFRDCCEEIGPCVSQRIVYSLINRDTNKKTKRDEVNLRYYEYYEIEKMAWNDWWWIREDINLHGQDLNGAIRVLKLQRTFNPKVDYRLIKVGVRKEVVEGA